MSSVGRSFSQIRQPSFTTNGDDPTIFTYDEIKTACLAQNCTEVSTNLFIAPDLSSLQNTLSALNGLTPSLGSLEDYETVSDLGRTIRVGIEGDSNVVIFRLVKRGGTSTTGPSPPGNKPTGYIVLQNKMLINYDNNLWVAVVGSGYVF